MKKQALKKAVFLDRDGVLNECRILNGKPYPPVDAEALRLAADAPEALLRLKQAGFILICVTNQPDVARGTRTRENVQAMNEKVRTALPLDALYVCFHDKGDGCSCRKPQPGMLVRGMEEFGLTPASCFMVGDRASDIGAGHNAGCRSVFLSRGYAEPLPEPMAEYTCSNLSEAVDWILAQPVPSLIEGHPTLKEHTI